MMPPIKLEDAKTIADEVRSALMIWDQFSKQASLGTAEPTFIKQQFFLFENAIQCVLAVLIHLKTQYIAT